MNVRLFSCKSAALLACKMWSRNSAVFLYFSNSWTAFATYVCAVKIMETMTINNYIELKYIIFNKISKLIS